MFVVIDGVDWSGKKTQVDLIKKELKDKWKKVLILDFPRYGNNSAYFVEKYLNWWYWKNVSAKLASIFYAIDRYDAMNEIVKDFGKYDYIISNRYVSANMIHQACKIKKSEEVKEFIKWLYELEFEIFGIPKADKIIFLNINPENSQNLVLKKENRNYIKNWKKMDIHEEDINHIKNACKTANEIVDIFDDWIKIDCTINWEMMKKEDITKKIMNEIL